MSATCFRLSDPHVTRGSSYYHPTQGPLSELAMEQAEAQGMDNTRTRNWRQTHTSETERPCPSSPSPASGQSAADTEMASLM